MPVYMAPVDQEGDGMIREWYYSGIIFGAF